MTKSTRSAAPRRRKIGRALLGSAAALFALATFAAPASAEPFQQLLNGKCVGKVCKFNSTKVPAGKRLDIRDVSCYVRMGVTDGDFYPLVAESLSVLGADPTKIINTITLVTNVTGVSDGQIVISSNNAVVAFATAQQMFQANFVIFEGQVFETRCHISGDMAKVALVNQ